MKKKQKNKKVIIIILVCFVCVGYIFIKQQVQIIKYNKVIRENNEKIASEQREIDILNREKQNYKSDEAIEKLARERLGYVMPGEKVYKDKSAQQ